MQIYRYERENSAFITTITIVGTGLWNLMWRIDSAFVESRKPM